MEYLQLQTISTETVKPSKPTPSHLKSHPLSRLDHLLSVFEYRTPLVLFYAAPRNNVVVIDRLKVALSDTLSLFYPLAGRIRANAVVIDCNDEGVPLVVARANVPLCALLDAPNRVELVARFIPTYSSLGLADPSTLAKGWVPLAVQVSIFECGGIAIGSHVLHKVLDGISRTHFFKTWAAFATQHYGDVSAPDYEAALSLFPPSRGSGPMTAITVPRVLGPVDGLGQATVRAFSFSSRAITALKRKARSETVPHPTRVEAVSGFLWKHLMRAAAIANSFKHNVSESNMNKYSTRRPSVLIHAVDMRPHIRPPLPPTAYGKFTTHAIVHCHVVENQATPNLPELVAMIRQVFNLTKDVESISTFQGDGGEVVVKRHNEKLKKLKNDANKNTYVFTSWSGLDVDFGFGMPVWIGFVGGKVSSWFKNFVTLIHTPDDGIEAWLILGEQEMAILDVDSEFLVFASPNNGLVSPPRSSL